MAVINPSEETNEEEGHFGLIKSKPLSEDETNYKNIMVQGKIGKLLQQKSTQHKDHDILMEIQFFLLSLNFKLERQGELECKRAITSHVEHDSGGEGWD